MDNEKNCECYEENIDSSIVDPYLEEFKKIDAPSIKNVALMGPYGSGKTVILNELKKQNEDKYITINMMEFSIKKEEKDYKEKIENIEKNIVQQLVYQEDSSVIPFSKIKKEYPNTTNVENTIYCIVTFILLLFIYCFFDFNSCFKNIDFKDAKTQFAIVNLWLLILLGCKLLYKTLFFAFKNYKFSKINYKKESVELELTKYENVYNKNIDELIYFFRETSYDTVIFEDIDRYNDLLLFSHLRELNTLLNNEKEINKKITFIYAIKDDLFENSDKTKFFDYIIPVIPVVDFSNSYQKLKDNLKGSEVQEETLKCLSIYIGDYRILKNIVCEFNIYKKILKNKWYSEDNLFAIIVFKNLFPNEFAKCQYNNGILKLIFEEKRISCENEILRKKERIQFLTEAINNSNITIDPKYTLLGIIWEILKSKNVSIVHPYTHITGIKLKDSNFFNSEILWDSLTNKKMIEVSNSMYQSSASHNSKIELTEYQIETINKLYKLNNVKELNLYDLSVKEMEEEIDDCNDEILEYSNRSSSTFFEKNDDVFDRVKEKIYKDIKLERIEADLKAGKDVKLDAETIISENKTNRVFEFLKLVLIKGLISDDYQNYVSLVYDNTPIEENDNVFIENVYNSKGNDYDLELYDVKRICNILGNKIYNCKNAFNKYILMYLSKNKVELKKYIKSNKDNIFYVYTTIIKDIEIFNRIAETCFEVNYDNQCTYIFKDNDNIRRKDWLIVLGQIKPNIFNKQKDINRLKDEFSKLSLISFHNLKNERVDNLITNMKKISVKFKNLSLVNKNQYLKNLLINNDLYEVNYINLKQINASLSYKQLCEYECVKDYINENINRYLSILCDYKIITIENAEFYEYIIKKCNNKNDLVRYIIMNNVVLNDYKVVDDDKIALALCTSNISNVLPILKSELISNECKYQLLKKLPLEYVFDNKEDLKTIINKFQLYDTKIFIKKPVSILLDQLDKNSADDVKFVSNILENCDDKLTKKLLSKLKINENKEFLILDINKLNEMICNYLEKNKLYEYDIMESEKKGKVYKLKKIIENKSEIIEI